MNSASDRGVQQRADDRRSVSARGRRLATWLAAVPLAGLVVAGCGGGGGGGGPTTSTAWYEVSVAGVGSSASSAFEGGNIVLKGNDGATYTVPAVAGPSPGLPVTSAGGAPATLVIDKHPVNRICSISTAPTALGGRGSVSLSCVNTPINDTGLSECMPGVDCALQDGGSGRGAIAARLGKLNPSAPGAFDYTRICNNGADEGSAGCPSGAALGTGDAQWGCTRDNVTGLVWRVVDFPGRYTYGDALTIPVQGWCGRAANTWRLPSVDQLQSAYFSAGETAGADKVAAQLAWLPMLNFNRRNVADGGTPPASFSPEGSGFWSSTLVATATGEAWAALFQGNGRITPQSSNTLLLRVAPVSTADLASRFSDTYYSASRWDANLSAGTLLDRRSGLMWMMCSVGWSFNASAVRCDPVAGQAGARSFRDALAEGAAVNQDGSRNRGYSDWRVPNRSELASLVDCVRWRPSDASAGCTDAGLKKLVDIDLTGAGSYWSSSWVPGAEVFTVDFSTGFAGLESDLTIPFRVRLVRNAR